MNHKLKILPQFFEAVSDGRKTFEIRKDDRGFQCGDKVTLVEIHDPDSKPHLAERPTGNEITATIGYVTAFEQKPGYVVFSLIGVEKKE